MPNPPAPAGAAATAYTANARSSEADRALAGALFEGAEGPQESERDRDLSRVVDRLADRFGYGTIVSGGLVGKRPGSCDPEDSKESTSSTRDEHS